MSSTPPPAAFSLARPLPANFARSLPHRHCARRRPALTMVVTAAKPATKPASPCFSSGPCKKRPGYSLVEALSDAPLGRSHRSALGKEKLAEAIRRTKDVLQIPEDYRVAIVPGSDTGAFEMAMWSMLGRRPVDLCYWESFGKGWLVDAINHLRLEAVTDFAAAEYGMLPNFSSVNKDHDVLFTFNGTTSGVRVEEGLEFIKDDRAGLSICDATSAVFAMHVPWGKVDVLTFSWQKVLGGEAAHGMLVLSPRAVERLESYVPPRPLPKIFRMTRRGRLDEGLFEGNVINTVSMMCVEDYLDALKWCDKVGGLDGLVKRSMDNLAVLEAFVDKNDWIDFLAKDPKSRSNTSVCLTLDLPKDKVKKMVEMLAAEEVAYDINSYRDAPPGLRIWCGATVEAADLQALTQWIEWAYNILADK
ncbi:phosphoserine aminotransferase [Chondrus crispus]|uniref:phosphoserine transaminase n=1 Tax=Chondrus crispus TaxID=2769 RepID=R7Q6Y9_CHOCR|nr:phosphoserine aminotransferase [Chondrus crispus]CDF33235.1 phosphoserine aminotransferase [Chondrus crispus]|eukprot:XP_005713038.1 phosphoserine aminotransferase [Chondrus crispus]